MQAAVARVAMLLVEVQRELFRVLQLEDELHAGPPLGGDGEEQRRHAVLGVHRRRVTRFRCSRIRKGGESKNNNTTHERKPGDDERLNNTTIRR